MATFPTLSVEKVRVVPSSAAKYFVNAENLYAKPMRNFITANSVVSKASNFNDLIPSELGLTRAFPKSTPSLDVHVVIVLENSSGPKVVGIDARPIVPIGTVVQNPHSFRNRTPVNYEARRMRGNSILKGRTPCDASVSISRNSTDPKVASPIISNWHYLFKEPIHKVQRKALRRKELRSNVIWHSKSHDFVVLAPSRRQPLGALELSHTKIWGSIK